MKIHIKIKETEAEFLVMCDPSMNTQAGVEISSLDYTIRLVELS